MPQQGVNRSQAALSAAQSQLDLARVNLERYESLYAQDAVSAATLDQYRNAYDQAAAQYNQAAAAAATSENSLSYTSLTADADGVIAAVSAEPGAGCSCRTDCSDLGKRRRYGGFL